MSQLVVTLDCPDRPGIVHAITGAIIAFGGNITELQQFSSPDSGTSSPASRWRAPRRLRWRPASGRRPSGSARTCASTTPSDPCARSCSPRRPDMP
ncbi:ACT domain-containing protein [Tessaracoccus coleopterorum]|uniref:ACT domain-containing protein n=1 Tax=Tessaracoccus coleopterorum TaxID=2714950 RepID=UPI001E398828|nr:ACT domain-containing protein [Tessaracoccus coleopterorum]